MITKDELEYVMRKALDQPHYKVLATMIDVRDLCTDMFYVIQSELTERKYFCNIQNCTVCDP